MATKFYHYSQNNSGGRFDFDESNGITHHVIIEANTYTHANELAEHKGLYFDGYGDCECCGNRWHEQWQESSGTKTPCVYNTDVSNYKNFAFMEPGKEIAVHYLNGDIKWYGVLKE